MNKRTKEKQTRRANGCGTLEKRGKYWCIRYKDEVTGKRKRMETGCTDKKLAEKKLKEFVAVRMLTKQIQEDRASLYHIKAQLENRIEVNTKQLAELTKVSLSEMFSLLFESEEGRRFRLRDIIYETKLAYKRFTKKFTDWCEVKHPNIKSMDAVTEDICEEFLDYIAENGSPDLHRRCLTFLKFLWESFIGMKRIYSNPWRRFKNMKNIKKVKKRILTKDEMDALMKVVATKDLQTRAAYAFSIYTGQRYGDCCCMKWSSLQKVQYEGKLVDFVIFAPSKTLRYGTIVSVPVAEPLKKVIQELREAKLDDEYLMPDLAKSYLKPTKTGGTNHGATINRMLIGIMDDAGISRKNEEGRTNVGMHSIRHGFVSKLAMLGKPMVTIQSMVGHTSERMTEYYSHADIQSKIETMNVFDGVSFE